MKVTYKILLRFALVHSKFYPFPPLPPPTNVGSLVCILATTRFHIFLYVISARQPTLQGGGRGENEVMYLSKISALSCETAISYIVPK